MNQEEKDKWIALIEGVAAGRELQYLSGSGAWNQASGVVFSTGPDCYRLKPREPRSVEKYVYPEVFMDGGCAPSQAGDNRVRVRITEIL